MKRFSLSLSLFLFITVTITSQDRQDYPPPSNVRNNSNYLNWQIDLMWTPPAGWVPSAVDRWFDYDRGIYGGNSLGSCPGCPVEIAIRWDANYFNMYDSLYISKIRYVLTEPAIDYAARVYNVDQELFDTLLNYPLTENLVYNAFDTLELEPILLDITRELWVGLWVSDMAPGYPIAVGMPPVMIGYGNMIKFGHWEPLTEINPDLIYPWNIGAYLETPNEITNFPVFNVYRSLDNQPYEKIHEGSYYDTIYYDYIHDLDPSHLYYYVTCVYEDGESLPSDTLHISFVNNPEIVQKSNIKVFPNPAKDLVSIESEKGRIKSLSLINNNGEIIMDRLYDSEKIEIDVSDLPASFYIARMITNDGVFTSKLLILK